MKKIAKIISSVLLIIGFAIFFVRGNLFGIKQEIPLGEIKGIIVDSNKNIYVGCGFYDRIQVYDKDGKFIRNWKIPAYKGDFTINFSKDRNISIVTLKNDKEIVYSKTGEVLNTKSFNSENYISTKRNLNSFKTNDNKFYEIKGNFLFRKIIVNKEKTLVNQNIWLQLINGPKNNFLLIVLGIIIGILGTKKNTVYNTV
jgi:hypothetical protein